MSCFSRGLLVLLLGFSLPALAQSIKQIDSGEWAVRPVPAEELPAVEAELAHERQGHSWQGDLCIPLPDYQFTTRSVDIYRGSYAEEDRLIQWDALAQYGLFKKEKTKKGFRYVATPAGKRLITDEKCVAVLGEEKAAGRPALLYGKLVFDRFVAGKLADVGQRWRTLVYRQKLVDAKDFSQDRDLRRAWKLVGLTELDETQYCVQYRITSNGIEIGENTRCITQRTNF